ncbi:hypothetical protein PMI06_009990 [Burkholderia sp. BT03]|nr:hypothetical protein PMI06_009990 [Burkholderia sp. BT03]SKC74873.1 hypothetical protein SAMN06266956_2721 [Paraburkholderia hospita]
MNLTFLGASETVTGSKYLLEEPGVLSSIAGFFRASRICGCATGCRCLSRQTRSTP